MFLQSAFDISQYIFIIWFTTELRHCVDYDMLFSNGNFTEERRYVPAPFKKALSEQTSEMNFIKWLLSKKISQLTLLQPNFS